MLKLKKFICIITCVLLVATILQINSGNVVRAAGTSYYVSYSDGNDNYDGLSPSSPWKTLDKVSTVTFNPGDTIYLKCGDIWSGQKLILKGNGTATNMITLTSYGTGNKPVITSPADDADVDLSPNIQPDARTSIKVGIKLKNYVGWKIKGLEISNAEYGIVAYNATESHLSKVWIEDCYIHNISGGRMFTAQDNPKQVLLKSDGIFIYRYSSTIKDCNIQHTARAISLLIGFDITIDNCYIYDSYTEGVSLVSVMRGKFTNSQIHHTGYPSGVFHGIAAVLFGSCNDVSIEDCTISDVYDPSIDGVGIDFEGVNTNITALRCNIYDCDSSAFLIYNVGNTVYDNSVSRIIDCRVDNCGRRDPSTLPAFIRHYDNINNNGVIMGNNIRKATASQALNYINVVSPQQTESYPSTYTVLNNTVYSQGQSFPSVQRATSNSWTASNGFTSTQGSNQWYYQMWDGNAYYDMNWDAGNSRWIGDTTYVLVGSNWQHPDNIRDSVRKWVAPKAGSISITGIAKKDSVGGDGVAVYIKKNSNTIFGPVTIDGNNTTGISTNVSQVNVDAGDAIYFVVNMKGDITSDATIWDPTITMTTQNSWTAFDSFSNGQGVNQWYYDYYSISTPGVYQAMSWDSANSSWKGNATYLFAGSNWQHPEDSYNSVRKWIAPRDGTISISGTAKLDSSGGDGVKVEIVKNGDLHFGVNVFPEVVLFAEQLVNTTTGISTNTTTTVKAGDIIHFIVNKNSTISHDTTIWDPTITYN